MKKLHQVARVRLSRQSKELTTDELTEFIRTMRARLSKQEERRVKNYLTQMRNQKYAPEQVKAEAERYGL